MDFGKPYNDTIEKDNSFVRVIKENTEEHELKWHRDQFDRIIKILENNGWEIQYENNIPEELMVHKTYFIPKNTWHRVLKGKGDLVVSITEIK